MTEYLQLIGLTLAGGIVSLIGGVILLSRKQTAYKLADYATPFAAGALLAAVFLDLLRDGLELGNSETILYGALGGILLFFLAERFLHWFHHHQEDAHQSTTKPLIITGDIMHNALDGVVIAAAFLISPATGVVATLAVAAHEIPQEIGDFGLLLSKGMRRRNVLIVNALSALATTFAAVIAYALGSAEALPLDWLIGFSAGFLLYIAMSDIIPSIHQRSSGHKLFDIRPILLIVGVVVVGLAINLAHGLVHEDDHHGHDGVKSGHHDEDYAHEHDDADHELHHDEHHDE